MPATFRRIRLAAILVTPLSAQAADLRLGIRADPARATASSTSA